MKRFIFASIVMCILAGCDTSQTVNNDTVDSFNLTKYMGEWYEIARFDHWFERGMQQNKALYTLREDGKVDVTNSGIKNGKEVTVKGIAKTTDTPGLLRVSFFGPFYADYRILYIDAAYQYALIGSGSDDYLWMLAREPQLEESDRDILLYEAIKRGYDISKILWIEDITK